MVVVGADDKAEAEAEGVRVVKRGYLQLRLVGLG
jgi:hypothetical protein